MNRFPSLLICLLLCVAAGPVWDSVAVRKVREGIRAFLAGDYSEAGEAFDEADAAQPDDDRIAFDRACTFSAQCRADEAKELFQQAALSRDSHLSAAAHYNLGNLAASSARDILGPDPVNVEPDLRPEAIFGLLSAVGHYRDCLRINGSHEEARHNIELIRLFIKHIKAEWERRDREKARDELGLLEFLAMIEGRQQSLRSLSQSLVEGDDSPQYRQVMREASDAQRTLQQEVRPLREKMTAELQGAADPTAPAPTDNEQSQRIITLLHQLADGAGEAMQRSADQLQKADPAAARQTQRAVLDQLNQIYMVIAPYQHVLQRAIPHQQQQVAESEGVAQSAATEEDTRDDFVSASADGPEQAWKQSRISDWSRLLALKAEAELPQVETQLSSDEESAADDGTSATDDDGQVPQPDPTEQLQSLAESMRRAVELAPQVEEHSVSAENQLRTSDRPRALPDQQEALRLLKEIAEPLKSQQDQNEDQSQSDEPQNEDGEQEQDGRQDQQQPPRGRQQQNQQDGSEDQQQQQNTERERAESVLRRARERERGHRDLEKELRRILGGAISVEKDW